MKQSHMKKKNIYLIVKKYTFYQVLQLELNNQNPQTTTPAYEEQNSILTLALGCVSLQLRYFKNSFTQKNDMHILEPLSNIFFSRITIYLKIRCFI